MLTKPKNWCWGILGCEIQAYLLDSIPMPLTVTIIKTKYCYYMPVFPEPIGRLKRMLLYPQNKQQQLPQNITLFIKFNFYLFVCGRGTSHNKHVYVKGQLARDVFCFHHVGSGGGNWQQEPNLSCLASPSEDFYRPLLPATELSSL